MKSSLSSTCVSSLIFILNLPFNFDRFIDNQIGRFYKRPGILFFIFFSSILLMVLTAFFFFRTDLGLLGNGVVLVTGLVCLRSVLISGDRCQDHVEEWVSYD